MYHKIRKKGMLVLFWLLVWHLLALWVDNEIILVTPVQAVNALCRLVLTGSFWMTIGGSLLRILTGFFLGFATACIMAAAAFAVPVVEEILEPFVDLLRAVPVVSFVVLLLIWWGSSFLAVSVCFIVVFPIIYVNVLKGLHCADGKLLEMASVFCVSRKGRFFYIYRPALRPFAESGLKLALGMCWKSGVAAEIIGTPDYSIGERLYMSKIYLDTGGLFAWTAVVILLSILFEQIFMYGIRRFFRWEPCCRKKEKTNGRDEAVSPKVIRCRKVSKSYGTQKVIREFDAEYHPGRLYEFTSPSGSGKTTLFRLLCGLEEADSGVIEHVGVRFGYAFQEDRLCEEYSAVKNVELAADCDAEAALEKVLPREVLYKPCGQLSGGMKRRVAVVRAMETKAACVILDEPFAGLDKETKKLVEDYIRQRAGGRILLVATHE